MKETSRAIVLLSGGLDSAVVLALCRDEGFAPSALTLDYGQRHRLELNAARRITAAMGVERHEILTVDLSRWGGSALTGDHSVPTGRDPETIGNDIPITYVPARNTVFLSIAMSWAETLGTEHIYIGAHALDYSGYPDCRPEYFRAFETMADLATRIGVEGGRPWRIHAPLVDMTKTEIVRRGRSLAVPFELTMSCYQPAAGASCGVCDACILRLKAFAAAGLSDPISYAPTGGIGS